MLLSCYLWKSCRSAWVAKLRSGARRAGTIVTTIVTCKVVSVTQGANCKNRPRTRECVFRLSSHYLVQRLIPTTTQLAPASFSSCGEWHFVKVIKANDPESQPETLFRAPITEHNILCQIVTSSSGFILSQTWPYSCGPLVSRSRVCAFMHH